MARFRALRNLAELSYRNPQTFQAVRSRKRFEKSAAAVVEGASARDQSGTSATCRSAAWKQAPCLGHEPYIARRANLPQRCGIAQNPKSQASSAPSRLCQRGASRSSRVLGAGYDGRGWCRRTYDIDVSAKPCGPDAPRLASSLQSMMCRRRRQQSLVSGESPE